MVPIASHSQIRDPLESAPGNLDFEKGEVADDADTIYVGAMLIGAGSAWVDDAHFTELGVAGVGDQPARPLGARELDNLTAFTRLLGYVRYFHPSDEAEKTDWDALAVAAVDTVEAARTARELVATLRALFLPIAPAVRIDTRPVTVDGAALRPPGASPEAVVRWRHQGYGFGVQPQSIYYSRRNRRPFTVSGVPSLGTGADFTADLGGGLWCAVPMALYADSVGTLPHPTAPAWKPSRSRPEGRMPTGDDRATRLAGVALFWNVAEHFYPYFDVVRTDWPAALREALSRAATDRNGEEFTLTLRRMVAQLHDGHGWVTGRYDRSSSLPVLWEWVEGRLVITQVASDLDQPKRGDVVLAIDGKPTADCMAEITPLISAATPQYLRYVSQQMLKRGAGGDSVTLDVRSPTGDERRVRLGRAADSLPVERRPEKVARREPGIWYLDLDRIDEQDLTGVMDSLAAARGILFDLRGYPGHSMTSIFAHLTDTTITSARWNVPIVLAPDHRNLGWNVSNWKIEPLEPRLRARVAFLTDGRAISAAETYLGIVEAYRLAEIVGGPTAGTNGNVVTVALPGGYSVRFTGMRVLKHDGSQHHGVGILPTVPASRTLAGVAAGRDEILEKAIEVVGR